MVTSQTSPAQKNAAALEAARLRRSRGGSAHPLNPDLRGLSEAPDDPTGPDVGGIEGCPVGATK